jgi:hypothetical protein
MMAAASDSKASASVWADIENDQLAHDRQQSDQ